jgi:NAD(P)-dependent dehydrogenase (short-subunit alcohol dehydrogenase family)
MKLAARFRGSEDEMQINQHTVLVSGGSSGLGEACVRRFLRQGARVIIADLAPPGAEITNEFGSRVFFQPTDVTREDDVRALLQAGEEHAGPLRGAVLCAGIAHAERVLGRDGPASLDAFRRVIEINLVGTFNVVRLAAEAIARQQPLDDGERGAIVMTASVAAFDGQTGQAAYAASKGGVAAMALPLARDLARQGIRVNVIAPGVFETPMVGAMPENVRDSLLGQTPFPQRFGDPDEFAALVQHAFENHMLNASIIRLDAGIRMAAR